MIFAANLKCNHNRTSFKAYVKTLNKFIKNSSTKDLKAKKDLMNSQANINLNSKITTSLHKENEILIFPPSTAFIKKELFFTQGAQNFYPCLNGAFTGELGKDHLDEFNINCVLLGHSERRVLLNESEELIEKKFQFAKDQGYKIILCIGESLEIKKAGQTRDFLTKQLSKLDLAYERLIIAYEPIYSIGTGLSADLKDLAEILEFLSQKSPAKLLYGGSVNLNNIRDILNLKFCNGVLIGSAALKADDFIALIKKSFT